VTRHKGSAGDRPLATGFEHKSCRSLNTSVATGACHTHSGLALYSEVPAFLDSLFHCSDELYVVRERYVNRRLDQGRGARFCTEARPTLLLMAAMAGFCASAQYSG
jgi:hypothetical protein